MALVWKRPFLGPLYTWSAAVRGKKGNLKDPLGGPGWGHWVVFRRNRCQLGRMDALQERKRVILTLKLLASIIAVKL